MGSTIRIEPLKKDNFASWKIQVKALLIKNETWKYVNGNFKKPNLGDDEKNKKEVEKWEMNDEKAMSDLILAIEPSQLFQFKNCKTSNEFWLKLQKIYESDGPTRKATLLKYLSLTKLKNEDNLREHLQTFFETVDKLSEIDISINDDLLCILLLNSLPERFNMFRCAIESRDNLPTPDTLKTKILEENDSRIEMVEEVNNAFMGKKYQKKQSRNEEPQKRQTFKFKCHGCGIYGHKIADCRKTKSKYRSNFAFEESTFHTTEKSEERKNEESNLLDTKNVWCLDSGCTSHICKDINQFSTVDETEQEDLHLASNSTTQIAARGTVKIKIKREQKDIQLKNTLYVPNARVNLMSVSKITDRGYKVIFSKANAEIINQNMEIVHTFTRFNGLYYLDESIKNEHAGLTNNKKDSIEIWHKKMGHLNEADLKKMINKNLAKGIYFKTNETLGNCETCLQGKLIQTPFPKFSNKITNMLEIVHTDICGPMRTESIGGAKYFATFTDDYSRWCTVKFLKRKSDFKEAFIEYKNQVENEKETRIKKLQSDNGTEICSNEMERYLKKEGIQRRLSVPNTPEQNGISERKNRTLVEMARCLLIESGLPISFWAEAISTANYIRNRCISKSIDGKTPYELWTGRKPTCHYFQIFGTRGYSLNKEKNKGKFDPRGQECIFVGYSENAKAYRVWLPSKKKIIVTRDVKFLNSNSKSEDLKRTKNFDELPTNELFIEIHQRTKELDLTNNEEEDVEVESEENDPNNQIIEEIDNDAFNNNHEEVLQGEKPEIEHHEREESIKQDSKDQVKTEIRCGGRPKFLKTGFKGRPKKKYQTKTMEEANLGEISLTKAMNGQDKQEWENAIEAEFVSLIENDTWIMVERPKGKNIVGTKLILRNKYNENGTLEKRKARLVAKGYTQQFGIDFKETFAPVARLSSIRTIIAYGIQNNMTMHQLDVTTAYLNGLIDTEIFMETPDMFEKILNKIIRDKRQCDIIQQKSRKLLNEIEKGDRVCLMKKALYGLKQAGRQWYKTLNKELIKLNWEPLKSDPCVYKRQSQGDLIIIIVYVDDIILLSQNITLIEETKMELQKCFKIKDLGKLHYCLGIEFSHYQNEGKIEMTQKGYTEDLLKRFNMENCKPVKTPMEPNQKLQKVEKISEMELKKYPYQKLIGSLMYLAIGTRPDLAYAVSYLSQFNTCYNQEHWTAAKRVLRYLRGSTDAKITYKKSTEALIGYVDADWGNSVDDRKSYTGYVFKLSDGAISWNSRKQPTVALSSTEAEYMGLTEAAKEAIYLRRFLRELGANIDRSTIIFNDNQGAQKMCKNEIFHSRTKHIDIRHHFVRDAVRNEEVELKYLSSEEMPADLLTKGVGSVKNGNCLRSLGLTLDSLAA